MALYPPSIKGNIPSFYWENGAYTIKVPFEDNKMVPSSSYDGYALQVKSLNTNEIVIVSTTTNKENNILTFKIDSTEKPIDIVWDSVPSDGEEFILEQGDTLESCHTKPELNKYVKIGKNQYKQIKGFGNKLSNLYYEITDFTKSEIEPQIFIELPENGEEWFLETGETEARSTKKPIIGSYIATQVQFKQILNYGASFDEEDGKIYYTITEYTKDETTGEEIIYDKVPLGGEEWRLNTNQTTLKTTKKPKCGAYVRIASTNFKQINNYEQESVKCYKIDSYTIDDDVDPKKWDDIPDKNKEIKMSDSETPDSLINVPILGGYIKINEKWQQVIGYETYQGKYRITKFTLEEYKDKLFNRDIVPNKDILNLPDGETDKQFTIQPEKGKYIYAGNDQYKQIAEFSSFDGIFYNISKYTQTEIKHKIFDSVPADGIEWTLNEGETIDKSSKQPIELQYVQVGEEQFKQITNCSSFKEIEYYIIDKFTQTFSFELGQYYKCQIAYYKDETVGTYSGVQTIKCTSKPTIEVKNNNSIIQGKYTNADASEIIQQYRFKLYKDNALLDDTGWLLHNSATDISNENELSSIDNYEINYNIVDNNFSIIYDVITINNLQMSVSEILNEELLVPLDIDLNLFAELNYEDGYIDLSLGSTKNNLTGLYNILRSDDNDFNNWKIIYNFKLNQENPNKEIFKDFTIQQGKKYRYALQQYNKYNVKSAYVFAKTDEYEFIDNGINYRDETPANKMQQLQVNYTMADFEDMFLFDGKRSLKIRFNPKVSSFKTTILESKIDTLSSQYPVFFRNGYTNYKEFQLSGLIACEMDEQELFIKHNILDKNLNGKNFFSERNFKLEVLDWLNNNEPKLFRSSTEGNYIVKLMNVSLTPIEQLGRMIHSFNCTAYEVASLNYNNLLKYNLFNYNTQLNLNDVGKKLMHYKSTTVKELQSNPINTLAIYYLKIDGAMPGDKIIIQQKNSDERQNIVIGATGSYEIELDTTPIIYIGIKNSKIINNFTITYGYRVISTDIDDFNYIGKIEKYYVAAEEVETNRTIGSLLNSGYTKKLSKLWHLRVESKPESGEYEPSTHYINFGSERHIECVPGRVYEYDTSEWQNVEDISFGQGLVPIVSYDYISKIYLNTNGEELTTEAEIAEFLAQQRKEKNDE